MTTAVTMARRQVTGRSSFEMRRHVAKGARGRKAFGTTEGPSQAQSFGEQREDLHFGYLSKYTPSRSYAIVKYCSGCKLPTVRSQINENTR